MDTLSPSAGIGSFRPEIALAVVALLVGALSACGTDQPAAANSPALAEPTASAIDTTVATTVNTTVAPAPAQNAVEADPAQHVETPASSPQILRVFGVSTGSALNVRERPGLDAAIVGTLDAATRNVSWAGQSVTVEGTEWREIEYGSLSGWVSAEYLSSCGDCSDLAIDEVIVTISAAGEPQLVHVEGDEGPRIQVTRAPGPGQETVWSLGSGLSNVGTTGRRAQANSADWTSPIDYVEIESAGLIGWIPEAWVSPGSARVWRDVVTTSGAAIVAIDHVIIDDTGALALRLDALDVSVDRNASIMFATGEATTLQQWAEQSTAPGSNITAEVTSVDGVVIHLWIS